MSEISIRLKSELFAEQWNVEIPMTEIRKMPKSRLVVVRISDVEIRMLQIRRRSMLYNFFKESKIRTSGISSSRFQTTFEIQSFLNPSEAS